jgi:trimethylamine--corrinoid protein Co-methyltransferase
MARAKLEFLSKDDIERVHRTTIRVLEEVGAQINSDATVKMLVDAGASLHRNGKRVLIPKELVNSSLRNAPKSFLLAAIDKSKGMHLPATERLFLANGGEGVFLKDMLTGESRYATTEDVRNFTILTQEVPQIDFWWQMVGAIDQPAEKKYLTELKIAFENTTKHIQSMAGTAEEARKSIEMASIFTDGPEGLAKRPILSTVLCPISPLTFEKGLTEAQIEFSRAGIPVIAMVASVAGLTSPATLSGTMVQVNAENLASLVISQVAKKGSPWVYSSDSSSGDLKTGSINYGSFETFVMQAGSAQMARHYNLPSMMAGVGLEDQSLQMTDLEDGVPYMVLQSLIDSDLGSGPGGVDQAAGAAYEQLIVDTWIWELAKGFTRPFRTDESAMSFDTIRDAALDGNFLNKRHTMASFRKEFYAISHPKAVLTGPKAGGPGRALIKQARDEAMKIINKPRKPLVTKDQIERMERIVKRA